MTTACKGLAPDSMCQDGVEATLGFHVAPRPVTSWSTVVEGPSGFCPMKGSPWPISIFGSSQNTSSGQSLAFRALCVTGESAYIKNGVVKTNEKCPV